MPYFCGMENEIVILDSIEKFNRQCGFETLHPLVSVVDMAEAKSDFGTARLNYGLYALWLKNGVGGSNCNGYGTMEPCIAKALGQPEKLFANNTYQVKNYANFELGGFSEEAKRKYRDEHWEEDLQKAFDAGKRMAETIINS